MDSNRGYNLLFNAQINKSSIDNIKKQIQNLANNNQIKIDLNSKNIKPVNIKITTSEADIKMFQQRIQNQLDRLKIGRENVFENAGISAEYKQITDDLKNVGTASGKTFAQMRTDVDTFSTHVKQMSGQIKNVNKDGYTFIQMIELAAKKIAIWAISTGLVYGALHQLENGAKYVIELDNAMNEIRIVTGKTKEQVDTLAKSYNSLAKEMRTTTIEIARTSAELYRQGLTDSQVEERMKAIITYAKISSISLSESNDIITATANSTGRSVQNIIDIFSQLGDATASGADEIGEALQRTASSADNFGVSLERAASWLATISSVTRESASTIGRSLNSILSRYTMIRSKGFNDEDATNLNEVVKALTSIGIQATDATGQLRPFVDVMDDLGKIYPTLTENEKAYITTTLAGTYQRNRLITLLNNYTDSLKNYQLALNSAGVAEQKYSIYLESPQAKLDEFKATLDGLWQNTLSSGNLMGLVDLGIGLVNVADKIGLVNIALTVLSGFIGFKMLSQIKVLSSGFANLAKAIGLTEAASAGLLGVTTALVAGGILLLVNAANNANVSLEEQKGNVADLSSEVDTLINKIDELKSKEEQQSGDTAYLDYLQSQLSIKKELLKVETTRAANQEFNEFDNGIINFLKGIVSIVGDIQKAIFGISNEKGILSALGIDEADKNFNKLTETKKQLEDIGKLIDSYAKSQGMRTPEGFIQLKESILEAYKPLDDTLTKIQEYKKILGDDLPPELKDLETNILNISDALKKYGIVIEDIPASPIPDTGDVGNAIASVDKLVEAYNKASTAIEKLGNLQNILKDKTKTSADAISYLIDNYDDLTNAGVDVQSMLSDTANLENNVTVAIQNQAIAQGLAYEQMIGFTQTYANVSGTIWQSLYTALAGMYGTDLSNFKNLATTKSEIDAALIKILGANWASYYKSQADALRAAISSLGGANNPAIQAEIARLQDMLNILNSLSAVSAKIKLPSFKTTSGGGSNKEIDAVQARIDIENDLLEAVKNRYEKELEAAKKTYEAKKAYLENERDLVQEAKDAYDAKYEAEQQSNELQELYKKRQNLIMGGQQGSAAYIDITKQIADMERELEKSKADTIFDEKINKIEKTIDESDKAFEAIQDKYETILNDTKALWQQVQDIEAAGLTSVLAYLKTNLEDFYDASATEQAKMIEEWKKLFKDAGLGSTSSGGGSTKKNVSDITKTLSSGSRGDDVKLLQTALKALGFNPHGIDGIFGSNTLSALKAFQKANGISQTGKLDSATKNKFKIKGYDEGGLADYTGLAMIHGSPDKPEGFLDSFDTKVIGSLMNKFELPKVLTNLAHGKGAGDNNITVNLVNPKFDTPENARKTKNEFKGMLNDVFTDLNRRGGLINNVITARP